MISCARCTLVWAVLLAAITGCTNYRYLPHITPIPARPIIDATAEFHDVYPAPALVSGKESFGLTGPNTKQVSPRLLTDQVEEEVLHTFDQAGVFSRITRFDRDPDLILTGRINTLYEHYRPRIWTRIPYIERMTGLLSILGVKTHLSSGRANLTLFVLTRNGELIGTYQGESSFDEAFNPTGEVAPGDRLNRALTEAVQQIQEQILGDAQLRTIASR